MRSAFAAQRGEGALEVADDRAPAAGLEMPDRGSTFGPMLPLAKWPFRFVPLDFRERHACRGSAGAAC